MSVSQTASFGNWTICPFDITYQGQKAKVNCSEQGMMFCKAILFNDHVAATKILAAKDPRKQKALGRTVRNFHQAVWDKEALGIMILVLTAKFEQNQDYAEGLLATGDKLLVEASVQDNLWGVGLSAQQCIDVGEDPTKWKGKNWLGHALMSVRGILKKGVSVEK